MLLGFPEVTHLTVRRGPEDKHLRVTETSRGSRGGCGLWRSGEQAPHRTTDRILSHLLMLQKAHGIYTYMRNLLI